MGLEHRRPACVSPLKRTSAIPYLNSIYKKIYFNINIRNSVSSRLFGNHNNFGIMMLALKLTNFNDNLYRKLKTEDRKRLQGKRF